MSRTAVRTVHILEVIARESKGLTLSEISHELEIPITSVNDIVKALRETEMIELLDARSKVYGIGVKAYSIGNAFIINTSLVDKSKGIIEDLSHKTGKTVFLGKEVNGRITYIYKYEPENPLVATCAIGSRTPLHCTSLGKSIMAFDHELLESLKGKALLKKTDWSITDYDLLVEDVNEVREKGYAIDDREQNDHLLCMGSPIFDSHGDVIAAVSISGLYSENADRDGEGRLVKEAALKISARLGYKGKLV
ncbi:MAG: IclR family transcriptional regulator [Spirochaetales bacterium]|nr:IclR family transcriptional regulator [Spirochaetales bacterium]